MSNEHSSPHEPISPIDPAELQGSVERVLGQSASPATPERQPYLNPDLKLYDPTGLLEAVPDDQSIHSWMQTAFIVNEALRNDPDNLSLQEGLEVIKASIDREVQRFRRENIAKPKPFQ